MSAIVNARDVLLQATSPRLLPVLLPGNITVPTANVIGYPDFYESARQVVLSATTQVFVDNVIGSDTPSSSILTASLKNILGTPTFTLVSGTCGFTLGTNTATITAAQLTSTEAVFQASVTANSITYTDKITILRVVEGGSSVLGFLTNESHMVPALPGGSVLSYGNSGGLFRVFQGSIEVTGTAVTYSILSASGCTIAIDATGTFAITNMSADTATATIRAVYAGTTIDKIYTVAKSLTALQGADGTIGVNGVRGNVNVARAIAGSSWLDSEATLALSTNGYGAALNRDIVTLYNTSTNYSESKFYNGSAWLSLDAYINGNMLVTGTVSADKIAADSITASQIAANAITANELSANAVTAGKISVTSLSAINSNLGAVTAGSINIASRFIVNSAGGVSISGAGTQHTEMDNSGVRVYDGNGTLRVRLGVW